jgi:hypothetical protein
MSVQPARAATVGVHCRRLSPTVVTHHGRRTVLYTWLLGPAADSISDADLAGGVAAALTAGAPLLFIAHAASLFGLAYEALLLELASQHLLPTAGVPLVVAFALDQSDHGASSNVFGHPLPVPFATTDAAQAEVPGVQAYVQSCVMERGRGRDNLLWATSAQDIHSVRTSLVLDSQR